MKTSFLKSFGIVSLSVLLVYSGIAWALENCLKDCEDHERAAYSEGSITSALNLAHHPITIIHCPVSHYEIGPMAQAASEVRLARSEKSVVLKTSLAGGSVIARETNSLWSHALFEWYAQLYSSSGVSRHLLLSVFRI